MPPPDTCRTPKPVFHCNIAGLLSFVAPERTTVNWHQWRRFGKGVLELLVVLAPRDLCFTPPTVKMLPLLCASCCGVSGQKNTPSQLLLSLFTQIQVYSSRKPTTHHDQWPNGHKSPRIYPHWRKGCYVYNRMADFAIDPFDPWGWTHKEVFTVGYGLSSQNTLQCVATTSTSQKVRVWETLIAFERTRNPAVFQATSAETDPVLGKSAWFPKHGLLSTVARRKVMASEVKKWTANTTRYPLISAVMVLITSSHPFPSLGRHPRDDVMTSGGKANITSLSKLLSQFSGLIFTCNPLLSHPNWVSFAVHPCYHHK